MANFWTPACHTPRRTGFYNHALNTPAWTMPGAYSIHSQRASFVMILRGLEVSDTLIARQTHHTNLATLSVYDQPEQAMQDSPAQRLVEAMAAGGR